MSEKRSHGWLRPRRPWRCSFGFHRWTFPAPRRFDPVFWSYLFRQDSICEDCGTRHFYTRRIDA